MAGVQRVCSDFKFLTITSVVQRITRLSVHVGQVHLINNAHHTIIDRLYVLQCEIPVHGVLQRGFIDQAGNPPHFWRANGTA